MSMKDDRHQFTDMEPVLDYSKATWPEKATLWFVLMLGPISVACHILWAMSGVQGLWVLVYGISSLLTLLTLCMSYGAWIIINGHDQHG